MRPGEVSNYAENLALQTVIEPVLQSGALARVFPNHPVALADGTTRFVDFAIVTDSSRIAIEVDGYAYHAEGAISREKFDDQLQRQNELTLQGWTVLRFSFDQIKKEAARCMDQLRRITVSDPQLHRNFTSCGLEPSRLQLEALEALSQAREKGQKRGLVALPTGTGKTILSALDAKRCGGRVLFIVHNNEILRQAALAYQKIFPDATIGFINSENSVKDFDADLVFANIASLRSRTAYEVISPGHFDYVVLDEFHHGAAPSYVATVKYLKPKYMLGLTATPERTDKKDVLSLLDGNLVYSLSVSEAIGRGFLVPFTYFGLHDNVDYSSIRYNGYRYDLTDLERSLLIPSRDQAIVEKYGEYARERKAIGFCVSIKHAERMAEVFCEAGFPSIAIHSGLPRLERMRRISMYERGQVQCVFVRDLFNEGVDFPDTTALMFLRPTESRIIFLQQLGRGLRLSPHKTNVVVLDFIGNYIGAAEIPSLLSAICTGSDRSETRLKPEFVYDNGCGVYFSERTIENLSIPEYKAVNRTSYIEKIIVLHERTGRPLTPLDIYIEIGDEFGHLIRAMGSYHNLIERMNRFDEEQEVLDAGFSKFDPSSILLEGGSADFLEDKALQVLALLRNVVENAKKGGKISVTRHRLRYAENVHKDLSSILRMLAPLCLVRNTIAVFAAETAKLPVADYEQEAVDALDDFFTFLAKRSPRRNSFADANFLRAELGKMLGLTGPGPIQDGMQEEMSMGVLNNVMERKSLKWLSDFHALTSGDSLHT